MGAETASHAEGRTARDDELVCGCIALTYAKLAAMLRSDQALGFEELLQRTGAGGKCTSCMLDLEYYFSTIPRDQVAPAQKGEIEREASVGLRRKVLNFIDGLSPLLPSPLLDRMPILKAPGVEQYVWISNQPIEHGSSISAPPMDIRLIVRDSEGHLIDRHSTTLENGRFLRYRVDSSKGADMLGYGDRPLLEAGSVEISRRARSAGVRGTTRPQIEVVSAKGACAVHSQQPSKFLDRSTMILHRPNEDRQFITVVNPGGRPISVRFTYPVSSGGASTPPIIHELLVPAQGARVFEIKLEDGVVDYGQPVFVRFSATGSFKAHLVSADLSLTRFSIDHI